MAVNITFDITCDRCEKTLCPTEKHVLKWATELENLIVERKTPGQLPFYHRGVYILCEECEPVYKEYSQKSDLMHMQIMDIFIQSGRIPVDR